MKTFARIALIAVLLGSIAAWYKNSWKAQRIAAYVKEYGDFMRRAHKGEFSNLSQEEFQAKAQEIIDKHVELAKIEKKFQEDLEKL